MLNFCFLRRISFFNPIKRRLLILNTRHYAKIKAKGSSSDFALQHFDQFYGSAYENWASIRLGLLCPHSYCAVVNSFSNSTQLSDFFNELGAYNMKDVYQTKFEEYKAQETAKYSDSNQVQNEEIDVASNTNKLMSIMEQEAKDFVLSYDISENSFVQPTKFITRDVSLHEDYTSFYNPDVNYNVVVRKEKAIEFPSYLNVYLFPRGKFKEFPAPKQDDTGLFNYYLMDGASILPVLALDVQKGEEVGDLCSSPGGKCLAVLFSLKFGKIVCNDISKSRLHKLKTVLNSYVPSAGDWNKRILVSNINVCSFDQQDLFDKILLDVPCTNDRLSATSQGNNIFKQARFNERMMLPKTQTNMLSNALLALKPGGSLVYSTCSLSPIQNDGVVHMSLTKLCTESNKQFAVQDLKDAFAPVQDMFQFSNTSQYGKMVVPFLPLNYGPMYICKINRLS